MTNAIDNLLCCYDFDGVFGKVSKPNFSFVEKCGYPGGTRGEKFRAERKAIEEKIGESALVSLMIDIFKRNNSKPTHEEIRQYVDALEYNPGVETYFDRIKCAAKNSNLKNYLISGGFVEYLRELPFAGHMDKIYGATFDGDFKNYDELKVHAIKDILTTNSRAEDDCRGMIYIGDGPSDREALRYVGGHGGTAILVHAAGETSEYYNDMIKDGIAISHYVEADFTDGSELFGILSGAANQTEHSRER